MRNLKPGLQSAVASGWRRKPRSLVIDWVLLLAATLGDYVELRLALALASAWSLSPSKKKKIPRFRCGCRVIGKLSRAEPARNPKDHSPLSRGSKLLRMTPEAPGWAGPR